jgi:selenocysteine lyase/cysteine desulfurase
MNLSRRHLVAGLGFAAQASLPATTPAAFPRKQDFAIPSGHTYINGAYIHPMPIAAAENVRRYIDSRSQPDGATFERIDIKAEFAALINANPSEIAYIPNTSTGENLIVQSLGIPHTGGNVVTDALHFEGALIHLEELRKQGLDLRIVQPRDGRIELKDLERVVDRKTKLIEISHVAMFTGFEHNLKPVCDLAHAHGALVYADVAQSAGATPIDVKATGVDFCACSSFKWLMGDFGLGFLYARQDLLDRVIKRPLYGYYQAPIMASHMLPFDDPARDPITYELATNATGHFEAGSQATAAVAALTKSLPYIRKLGPENIEAYRQPMLQRLHQEMPRLGFRPMTPADSRSALISFAAEDTARYAERLKSAKVNVRIAPHFIRVAPSIYNDMSDIDRFLSALS